MKEKKQKEKKSVLVAWSGGVDSTALICKYLANAQTFGEEPPTQAQPAPSSSLLPPLQVTVREKTPQEMATPYVEPELPLVRIGDMVILDISEDWASWEKWASSGGDDESPDAYGDWKSYQSKGVTHVVITGEMWAITKHGLGEGPFPVPNMK